MEDGWITIGTELATDKFDKQIVDLEKKMRKEEDKKVLVQAKLDTQEADLEKARAKTDELGDAYQRLAELKEKVNKTPTEFSELQGIQSQYGSMEKLGTAFDTALKKQDALELKVASTKAQYDSINSKVNEYKTKVEGIKLQKHQSDVNKIKEGFNGVGSSIQNAIGKVGRLALGIFAVRSAYMALRRASSDLASYDEQYATNLEYIRFVLTQAIAPVLRFIVSLASKLLQLIGMITQALFGVNIFSSGSAENFKKMKANAGGVSSAVKEIKKQLTGFDEINVLTDQSDTGTKAGAGGVGMPDFDISDLQGEPPEWMKWIIDNKDLLLSVLAGILAGILALKLGLGGIKALGIGVMVAGIIYAVQNLIKYLNDPSWENFGKIIQGIGIAIIGLGVIINSVPVIIAGAIVLIVGTIVKYWEQIKAFLQKGIDWLTNKSNWVHRMFGDIIGNIYDTIVKNLQLILNWFNTVFTSIKGIFDGIIKFIKGVFTGDWRMAWEGIKDIFLNIWNIIKGTFVTVFNFIKNMVVTVGQTVGDIISSVFKGVVNAVLYTIEKVLNAPIRAVNGLINVINKVPRNKSRKTTNI